MRGLWRKKSHGVPRFGGESVSYPSYIFSICEGSTRKRLVCCVVHSRRFIAITSSANRMNHSVGDRTKMASGGLKTPSNYNEVKVLDEFLDLTHWEEHEGMKCW